MRLPDPTTAAGAAGLAALLADPARAVVAVDFDGTLAPIVDRPADARPQDGALAALGRLARLVGAVAVLTGRPPAEAVELAGFAGAQHLDRLVVLGHYGLQRWDAATGAVTSPDLPDGVRRVREALPGVLAEAVAPAGTEVEDKEFSVAVHVRRTADPPGALARLRAPLAALADREGLTVQPGKMVVELRPPGVDKGRALRRFVEERDARAVLFAGDDVGDLPAYDAVEQLRAERVPGLTVCSASSEVTELQRRADIVVDGPAGVVRLFEQLAEALGSAG